MKIVFTGGGTMGPVTPLLAVWQAWKQKDASVEGIWVGTKLGPERSVVEAEGLPFVHLPKARFPRYVSVEWLLFPFRFVGAFLKAVRLLSVQKPDLVASAGGYTSVPVIYAAYLLGVRVWVHQQDAELLLTTKLTVPVADLVTVAWERNRNDLGDRVELVGNPVRESVLHGSVDSARKTFGLDPTVPTVLVMGGGTGAVWINQHVLAFAEQLCTRANILHVTGVGKEVSSMHERHVTRSFLKVEMADALAVADVVVSRAGLGSITELAALQKASILIPIPGSAQEANVVEVQDAVVLIDQRDVDAAQLLAQIEALLDDEERRVQLGASLHQRLSTDVAGELVNRLETLLN